MGYAEYANQRDAKVKIAGELERRGWKIFGYKEDQSDSMTDYFSPADWEGVAEKNGVVICVGVSGYAAKNYSGGRETFVHLPDAECAYCSGTGEEPDGWTLQQARELPQAFNAHRTRLTSPGAINLMSSVVSPISFKDNGKERCHKCHGSGHILKSNTVREYWPTFQANPKGSKWHVEKGGKILSKGIGLAKLVDANDHWPEIKARCEAEVTKLVDKMEAAAFGSGAKESTKPQKQTTTAEAQATFARTGAWTWLTFTAKPAQEVIDSLKVDGWRWSKKRCAWYNLDGKEPPTGITYLPVAN
jgi:hypothetical protein